MCILGTVLPYTQFVPWVAEHGLDVVALVDELFSTRIGAFFGLDVIVSALALLCFACVDGRRKGVPHRWLVVLATFSVGMSLGLPLYLLLRESQRIRRDDMAQG